MARARIQAAAIPYRQSSFGGYEVLLVSCSRGGWGIPKGGVKTGQSPEEAAAAESLEEAGVLGQLEESLGTFRYRKRGKKNLVHVFPLRVQQILARWEEEGCRHRVWVSLVEAPSLLRRQEVERFLIDLRHLLLARDATPSLRLVA